MKWLFKFIFGLFGLALFGPIGALIGIWLGHQVDKSIFFNHTHEDNDAQNAFFNTTFLVMGHIVKADGIVTQNEIRVAEQTMKKLNITGEKRHRAIERFNQGKSANFDLEKTLRDFRSACPFHPGLMRLFMDIQMQAAYANGHISPQAKQILQTIAGHLGLGAFNFAFYDTIFSARQHGFHHFKQEWQKGQQQSNFYQNQSQTSLQEAYALLGISKNATDAEVKKAYRKMMNQNHPDKLIAKGLPEEMIKMATEKTQKIKQAYEQIRTSRGMK